MDAGLTTRQIRTLVRRGELDRRGRGVYVFAGAPDSWLQRAMVATLVQAGQLHVSRRSAAYLLGFDGFGQPGEIEVVAPRDCRPVLPGGASLHRTDVLAPSDKTVHRAIPTVNAAATLCLLVPVVHVDRVQQGLDHVLRAGWSPRWVRATAERLRRRGLHGPGVVLDLLADRVDRRLPRSWFERLAKRAFDAFGVELEHEYPLRDRAGRIVASLDLAEPRSQVGVECQSWEQHGTMRAAYSDTRRRRVVRRMGWEIVEVWWWDLEGPDEVLAEVRAAITRQQAQPRISSA